MNIKIEHLRIPLRARFKHASAERKVSDSVWVEITRGPHTGYGEGCPRAYVTGESPEGALAWLRSHLAAFESEISSLDALRAWSERHRDEIDRNPAAWCAMELAFLDVFAKEQGKTIEALLGLPELDGEFRYTAVLSDESGFKFALLVAFYLARGFRDFKLKISGDVRRDARKLALFRRLTARFKGIRLRVDGNNVWAADPAQARRALISLQGQHDLFGIEEPLAARAVTGLRRLGQARGLPVILDESVCRVEDIDLFGHGPERWIGNVRVSKMGGLLRSLECVREMRRQGWRVIVGAQVGETSVLSRAALTVARAAGDALVAQEGAYGTLLLEQDRVQPVVMFGAGGVLRYRGLDQSTKGLGLCR